MKKQKSMLKNTCSICGKEAPVNKEMSTENWVVYDNKSPCECGGKFEITLI